MGVFIDLDHLFDYLIYSKFRFSVRDFFDTCYNYRLKKFYLILHSYEFLLLSWLAYSLTKNEILLGISIGYTVHLVCDQFGNFTYPFSYFLSYRIAKIFEKVFNK
jgi:hypothetical protein